MVSNVVGPVMQHLGRTVFEAEAEILRVGEWFNAILQVWTDSRLEKRMRLKK